MSRRLAREIAIQKLYQTVIHPEDTGQLIQQQVDRLNQEDFRFYQRLCEGVLKHQTEIDDQISPFLKEGWSFKRLSPVDQSILRLAGYELFYEENTPPKVIINEAVELAKAFSGMESSRFINGVLGGMLKQREK